MSLLLFISPHLDDAVLSCGAYTAQLACEGHDVAIATVFTDSGQPGLYTQRREEDKQAARLLGVRAIHLGFTDAPFRHPAYNSFSSLLFHHYFPSEEAALVSTIADAISQLVFNLKATQVFFPLGVGGHIDHHIVFESSRQLIASKIPIAYYEELPYNLLSGWNIIRWQQLGAIPSGGINTMPTALPLSPAPFHFIQSYMSEGADTEQSILAYQQEWEGLKELHLQPDHWQLGLQTYAGKAIASNIHQFRLKCNAIELYSTEWPLLFGHPVSNIEKTLAIDYKQDSYIEKFWLLNNDL